MNPKVFVSHASEDKDRFVLEFATELREKGIDVWVDKWEMLPGDSLVQKIFEEGIKNAQAIIVVLSQFSVNKPWVREELNVSMVRKIDGSSKLIPVVIDECEIPECLKATVWEKITDLDNYDDELSRIINSILGHRDIPPLGEVSPQLQKVISIIPNLTKIDTIILKLSAEQVRDSPPRSYIDAGETIIQARNFDISESEVRESLEILCGRGYIESHGIKYQGVGVYSITSYGFSEYASVYVANYDSLFDEVAFKIVNEGLSNDTSIRESLQQPVHVIDHIIDWLLQQGLITAAQPAAGGYIGISALPELKRRLGNK